MSASRSVMTVGLPLIALVFASSTCGPGDKEVKANALGDTATMVEDGRSREEVVPVVATTVQTGAMSSWIMSSGNLEAIGLVDVLAKVQGQVDRLLVEEGTRVRAGDTLLELDPDEYRLRAERAEAEADKKRSDLLRYRRMLAEGVLSKVDFAQAEYEVRQADLALEQAQLDLVEATVRAPIDGVISSRLVHRGARVSAHQHLFTIVDPDELWVHVHVPETDLPGLEAGQPATISTDVLAGREFQASVERISPVVDPQSGTAKVTVRLADATGLRPGMFVNVRVTTAIRENALLLSKRAIVYAGASTVVFRIDGTEPDLIATRVAVRMGASDANRVEILQGLEAGDRVVVLGQDALRSGVPVRTVEGDAVGLPLLR